LFTSEEGRNEKAIWFSGGVICIRFPFTGPRAQETGPFYAGVFGGYTFSSDATWTFVFYDQFAADLQETWVLGAKFGYTPPAFKYFAVELEYFYLKHDIDRSAGSSVSVVSGDATLNNFMVNFLVRYPQGRFHPYLGFGLGVSSVDVSGTRTQQILGSTVTQPLNDSDTSFAYQILLGVNYEINKNWSADLTYRWFGTDPQIHGGDVDYTTNMITVGVNYHF
jgi:OOP family OmpA-OmpF porin